MQPGEKRQFKQKLEEQLKQHLLELKELEEITRPIAPENAIGRLSRMDAINNKSVSEAALRSKKAKIAKLRIAISKLPSEHFGICERCKRPIGHQRLMYMPESTYCIRCADRA